MNVYSNDVQSTTSQGQTFFAQTKCGPLRRRLRLMPASLRRPLAEVGAPCWIVVGRTEHQASVVALRDDKVLVRWSTTFEDHAKWLSVHNVRGDRRRYCEDEDLNRALAFSVSTAPRRGRAIFPAPSLLHSGDSSADESDDGTRPEEISDSECDPEPPPPEPPEVRRRHRFLGPAHTLLATS